MADKEEKRKAQQIKAGKELEKSIKRFEDKVQVKNGNKK